MGEDHWGGHSRVWDAVGPPLRPAVVDVEAMRQQLPLPGAAGVALLLGVTPELAAMDWPAGYRVLAVDRCASMVRDVWPGTRAATQSRVVIGDWLSLPVASDSCRTVVADGCHVVLPSVALYDELASEVCRVLEPDGRYLVRIFVKPETPEAPETVFAALRAGRISNFHAFKWRLAMALQAPETGSVKVDDIWRSWAASRPDTAEYAARFGWPERVFATIESYRGSVARYTFPTLAQIRSRLSQRFREISLTVPDYELGERCPLLTLAPR